MSRILAILFALLAFAASAASTSPFQIQGKTQTFTAAGTPPTPVQVLGDGSTSPMQYVITNVGAVTAFIACEATSGEATASAGVPVGGTGKRVHVVQASNQVAVTCAPGAFFTGATSSSTAIIYVAPGEGM